LNQFPAQYKHLIQECKQKDKEVKKIDEEINTLSATIEKMKEQLAVLEEKKQKQMESSVSCGLQLEMFNKYYNGKFKEDQETVARVAAVELNIMEIMKEHLCNPSHFGLEGKLPLPSFLSMMGVSISTIRSLEGVKGDEFLYFGENALMKDISIDERTKVEYARLFLQENLFLGSHWEECCVCFCRTPEEFSYLLEEHNIVIDDEHLLKYKKLNGPQTLCVNRRDIQKLQKQISRELSQKKIVQTILYLRELHNKATVQNLNEKLTMKFWDERGISKFANQVLSELMNNRKLHKQANNYRQYDLRLVRERELPDGTEVNPGQKITKVWTVRNAGEAAWPPGTMLEWQSGDKLGVDRISVPEVEPGQDVDIETEMVAPHKSGHYTGHYRSVLPNGTTFGNRVWIDFIVNG